MADDTPIAFRADGSPIYDNAPTVVVGVLTDNFQAIFPKVLLIRRKCGRIALPGGFHMRGETWQQALSREVMEETTFYADPLKIEQFGETVTDEYGHNLVFGKCSRTVCTSFGAVPDGEILEAFTGDPRDFDKEEWAFPLHYKAACDYYHFLRSLPLNY